MTLDIHFIAEDLHGTLRRYCNLPLIIPGLIQLPKGFKEGMEGLVSELKKCYIIKATYFL